MTDRPNSPVEETRPAYTVLIVDDDAETLRYLGSLLIDQSYRVYVADNGRLALDIARKIHPDVLLLDIVMPGWNGVDTCRALKQDASTRAIPVIFLTGREDEVLEAFNAGAADYVVKPFDARVLLARVKAHAELGALSGGLEQALTERTRELRTANARLRRLATDLALIEERERAQLAGDLHAGPLQKLALAQLQLDAGLAPDGKGTGEGLDQLAAGAELLRDAIGELRSLQFELSPPVLHQAGLPPALDWLATHTRERWGIALNAVIAPDLPPIQREHAVILFQCARELVHNLIKHAGARGGQIALSVEPGGLCLAVEDDGRSFQPPAEHEPNSPLRGGYGLYQVDERLRLLGGRLDIESPAIGSRLVMRLPLGGDEHPEA